MGMQLNIKSDDAYRLATELAALTGESLTGAVTTALRERLDRERREREKSVKVEQMLEMAREIRAHMQEPVSSIDHNDLYDEDGYPA
jgi:antitoxin VapB